MRPHHARQQAFWLQRATESVAIRDQNAVVSAMTRHRVGTEKQILWEFLDQQFDVILWKMDGLADEQLRQPVTPTGMCLLALAKHVAGVPNYWLCEVFGRPFEPWPG